MLQAPYPRWCAAAYTWSPVGTGAWMGIPPLLVGISAYTLTLHSIVPSDQSFSFRATVGTFGGRLIELGFVCWIRTPPVDVGIARMVWSDGAEQIVRGPQTGGSYLHWEQLQSSTGIVAVPGAQVWNTWHFVGDAVPY